MKAKERKVHNGSKKGKSFPCDDCFFMFRILFQFFYTKIAIFFAASGVYNILRYSEVENNCSTTEVQAENIETQAISCDGDGTVEVETEDLQTSKMNIPIKVENECSVECETLNQPSAVKERKCERKWHRKHVKSRRRKALEHHLKRYDHRVRTKSTLHFQYNISKLLSLTSYFSDPRNFIPNPKKPAREETKKKMKEGDGKQCCVSPLPKSPSTSLQTASKFEPNWKGSVTLSTLYPTFGLQRSNFMTNLLHLQSNMSGHSNMVLASNTERNNSNSCCTDNASASHCIWIGNQSLERKKGVQGFVFHLRNKLEYLLRMLQIHKELNEVSKRSSTVA